MWHYSLGQMWLERLTAPKERTNTQKNDCLVSNFFETVCQSSQRKGWNMFSKEGNSNIAKEFEETAVPSNLVWRRS